MIPFLDLKSQYKELKPEIDKRIAKVLEHTMFINGPEVKEFEQELCKFTGAKHSIACSNGTDALTMALMTYNIGPGDEVITTAFSFFATAETIALLGAKPVFVDIDPNTYNIDASLIEDAITDKTKAILPVSLYGQVYDCDEVNSIAKKHKLPVIEDAAQSFGATYKGTKSCNLTDVATTSFFPAKPFGCYGDGGALFTNDDSLAEKLRFIRDHGQTERYKHTMLGINGRLDSLQCAIMLAKFPRYEFEVGKRQEIANRYTTELKDCGLKLPSVKEHNTSVWAQYTLQSENREAIQASLKEQGVPTAIHYPIPMSEQPAMKELSKTHGSLNHSLEASKKVFSIPIHPELTNDQVSHVIEAIKKSL